MVIIFQDTVPLPLYHIALHVVVARKTTFSDSTLETGMERYCM